MFGLDWIVPPKMAILLSLNSFLDNKLKDFPYGNGLATSLIEAEKGHGQELALANSEPTLLEALRRSSIITSSIASCAIEQIYAPEFEKIALSDKPLGRELTREERELANYKSALEFVYSLDPKRIRIEPDFIRRLHAYVRADAGDAGEYKGKDNQILEITEQGVRERFKPVSARETPHFMDQLCLLYERAIQKEEAPALLCVSALALDLTAIHPFSDGNGRVSRVLVSAAMIAAGYQLPKYVSLEEINDRRSHDYYRALELSSHHWHERKHDLGPFLRFQTGLFVQGYREFAIRRERSNEPFTVIFHERVPIPVREKVLKDFIVSYPKATMETTEEGVRDVYIKGSRTDLPEAEWEKFNHPERLARHLLNAIKFERPPEKSNGIPDSGHGGGGYGGGAMGGR